MVFAALQKDKLASIELDNLDSPAIFITPPVESPFTDTKEAFPFLTEEQVMELEDVGAALILCEEENLQLYYKQIPELHESAPICMYFDEYNKLIMQK